MLETCSVSGSIDSSRSTNPTVRQAAMGNSCCFGDKGKLPPAAAADTNHSMFALADHSEECKLHVQRLWHDFACEMALSDAEAKVPACTTKRLRLTRLPICAETVRPLRQVVLCRPERLQGGCGSVRGDRNGDEAMDADELGNLLGDFISAYLDKLKNSREQVLLLAAAPTQIHTSLSYSLSCISPPPPVFPLQLAHGGCTVWGGVRCVRAHGRSLFGACFERGVVDRSERTAKWTKLAASYWRRSRALLHTLAVSLCGGRNWLVCALPLKLNCWPNIC